MSTDPPQIVRIEPSSACNLHCIHCPTGTGQSTDRGLMSRDTFDIVLREVAKLRPRVVVLYHGGEPFLHHDIFRMVRELKALGIGHIKTVTNGTVLKEHQLPELVRTGLDRIELSLDGTSGHESDRIRRGSDHRRILALVRRLVEVRRDLRSTMTIAIVNCQIPTLDAIGKAPEIPAYLKDAFPEGEVELFSCWSILWAGMPTESPHYRLYEPSEGKTSSYCEHPFKLLTIRHNGDVVPCCYDTTSLSIMGNIHDDTIETIWDNDRYNALRYGILHGEPPPLCSRCHMLMKGRLMVRPMEVTA